MSTHRSRGPATVLFRAASLLPLLLALACATAPPRPLRLTAADPPGPPSQGDPPVAWPAATTPATSTARFHDPGHDHGVLHFAHPLVTESPSPDTKVRLDAVFANEVREDGAASERSTANLEAEWAFDPTLSVEVDVPYTSVHPDGNGHHGHLDTVSVALKTATFPADHPDLLLGGGLEVGLPTGDDDAGIGSDHIVEVEPFVDLGWRTGAWELVAFLSAARPLKDRPGDGAADYELALDVSALRHVDERWSLLLELNGVHVKGGEEDGLDAWTLTPGVKVQPGDDPSLQVGLGVSLPVSEDKEFHARTILSVFKHF